MGHAGRRIWIIGASAGIGAALARALAGQGAQLILSARDGDALGVVATECGGAQALPLDLGQPETLAAVVKRLALEAPLDAIICTAALYDPGRVADIDPAQAEAMVRVNILGMIEVARQCPPLLRDGGQLVLFGSVAGYIGLPGAALFSDQGCGEQPGRNACGRTGTARGRAAGLPWLRPDQIDSKKRLCHARKHHPRAGGRGGAARDAAAGIRDPFPAPLHLGDEAGACLALCALAAPVATLGLIVQLNRPESARTPIQAENPVRSMPHNPSMMTCSHDQSASVA